MSQNDLRQALTQAVRVLNERGVVGMPTETVYGLAADARSVEAVAKIFQVKNRPFFDPLIVHVPSIGDVEPYVREFSKTAQKLAERFWPGPLTMILPKREIIPDLVTSGLPHVALRIPAHPVALELLREFGGPLAAPSANKFGRISPTTAAAVRAELGDEVGLILDGGPCRVGIESTIIHLGENPPMILRQGGVAQEEIEKVVGPVVGAEPGTISPKTAPGMLEQHYAPQTPLQLLSKDDIVSLPDERRHPSGLLSWGLMTSTGFKAVRNLSATGSSVEGAMHLFQYLRELDQLGLTEILAVAWDERELGRAINDRLRRASHR